jgi:ABC-type amino acid transport substrate-binding protein
MADVAGERIGQLANCANEAELAEIAGPGRLALGQDFDELASMVAKGSLTGFLYDLPNAKDALTRHPLGDRLRVRPLQRDERYPLTTGRFPNHLVFRAQAYNLCAGADLALDALKTSGEVRQINARYGFGRELEVIV